MNPPSLATDPSAADGVAVPVSDATLSVRGGFADATERQFCGVAAGDEAFPLGLMRCRYPFWQGQFGALFISWMGTFGQSDGSARRPSMPRLSRTVSSPKLLPPVWARWVKLPLGNWSHWDRPALSCQIWPLPLKSTRAGGARNHTNSASRYWTRWSGWSAGRRSILCSEDINPKRSGYVLRADPSQPPDKRRFP